MLLRLIERRKGSIKMSDFNKIIGEAWKAADEIIQMKTIKQKEIDQATAAVKAADAEMEQAALAGDETAYAKAKERRSAAENRLEIIRIQEQKQAGNDDSRETAFAVMRKVQADALEEMRKISGVFLSQYENLLKTVAIVSDYKKHYNELREYMKNHVLRTTDFPFQSLEEIFPVNHMTDIERRQQYSIGFIRDAVNKH